MDFVRQREGDLGFYFVDGGAVHQTTIRGPTAEGWKTSLELENVSVHESTSVAEQTERSWQNSTEEAAALPQPHVCTPEVCQRLLEKSAALLAKHFSD